QSETRPHGARAFDEQLHGRGPCEPAGIRIVARCGNVEHRYREDLLVGEPEWLAASAQDVEGRGGIEKCVYELRRGVDDVFAVVDDKQEGPVGKVVSDHVRYRLAGPFAEPQRRGEPSGNEAGVANRSELDEPGAVGEPRYEVGRGLDGQARLSDAAHPRKRYEPVRLQQLLRCPQVVLAADEARQSRGQGVVRALPWQPRPRAAAPG